MTSKNRNVRTLLTTTVLAFALILSGLALPAAADHDGTDEDHGDPGELECREDPSFAEIVNLNGNQLTVQVDGNQHQLDLPTGDAVLISLDGGFYVDIDYHCLEGMEIIVYKDGSVVHTNGMGLGCGSGTHTEWVPVGLDRGTYDIVVHWWGCDLTSGTDKLRIVVFDPPIFSPEAAEA